LDNFAVLYPLYRQSEIATLFGLKYGTSDSAHDWLLQTAATTGLCGVVALVALLVSSSVALFRTGLSRRPVVSAVLLASAGTYWSQALVSVGSVGVDWVPWIVF